MTFTDPNKAKVFLKGRLYGQTLAAFNLMLEHHTGTRKDGATPEWAHQASILMYLMTFETDLCTLRTDVYVAALLHDIHEDYGYPLRDIERQFGHAVVNAVDLLSKKSPGGPKKSPEHYYASIADDSIASIVKGADRIHNIQSMYGVFSDEKIAEYLRETDELVLPMLKIARKKHWRHRSVYENIKHVLVTQCELIKAFGKVDADD